jgi:hypothetical protein
MLKRITDFRAQFRVEKQVLDMSEAAARGLGDHVRANYLSRVST